FSLHASRAHLDLHSFPLRRSSDLEYAIFVLDPAGRVASWNAGAEAIKGYAADEILGQHVAVFYTPEDVALGKPQAQLEAAAREEIGRASCREREEGEAGGVAWWRD